MKQVLVFFESGEIAEVGQPIETAPSELFVPTFQCRVSKEKYIGTIKQLLAHIHQGDIYEINYCIEFYAENCVIDPHQVFDRLKKLTGAPFSQLVKYGNTWVICASPERFIRKEGSRLITQPMKGTARRGKTEEEDRHLKEQLAHSKKERSENVMAVDVARNDLSIISEKGTVRTEELFGVHTFKNVHQMISTISCELKPDLTLQNILDATFPPASMTGAPKLKAIELIRKYELSPRGIYSGCLGTIDANGDFDFCVVIRTILYDELQKKLSFHVGSAITAASNPEEEWNECMLKANTLIEAIGLNANQL